MEEKRQIGEGNVTIKLNGRDFDLIPTAQAMLVISRLNGGISGAINSVSRMDVDVILKVIEVGVGRKTLKDVPDLTEAVFATGLFGENAETNLVARCVEYLHVLSRGGRPVDKVEAAHDQSDPPKQG